jgi:putative redox protein
MRSERFECPGSHGQRLAARLDAPDEPPQAFALFAHCFTCGKDALAAGRIATALAARGIATLRFDFTGLGGSDGELANTGFSSNVEDLLAAAGQLRASGRAPALLIGHSLGGAAVLAAAEQVPEARAVAVIGAPFAVEHVVGQFAGHVPEIEAKGEAQVRLGGRAFTIRKTFLDDAQAQDQGERIARLGRALLVLHAPGDLVVGIENARAIFERAHHPKSFVSLGRCGARSSSMAGTPGPTAISRGAWRGDKTASRCPARLGLGERHHPATGATAANIRPPSHACTSTAIRPCSIVIRL